MPELPEVETIRRGLVELLPRRMVRKVEVFNSPKSFPNVESDVRQFLIGASVTDVRRRAKVLIIDLDTDYSVVVHLKMTGQLVLRCGTELISDEHANSLRSKRANGTDRGRSAEISVGSIAQSPKRSTHASVTLESNSGEFGGGHPTDSLIGGLPDRSTRVQFDFEDGSKLFFNDQRKFGWVKLMPTIEVENMPFMQKVGPEPLDPQTTNSDFIQRVRRRNGTMIKPAILDQTVIAGVGNIYADEALWAAGIHPETRVRNVSDHQLNTLFTEIIKVLALSIEKGGSTDRNYVDAKGMRGSYLSFANVFRREGQPCRKHPSQDIVKMKVGGRGTHICPVCQVGIVD